MSNVSVQKYPHREVVPAGIFESVQTLVDEIQRRAFGVFQRRGGTDGGELDDWLQAERQLLPEAELVERENEFQLRVALPGYEPKDIQVVVLPDSILVQAKAAHRAEGEEGRVRFSEFKEEEVARRVELPDAIDMDRVVAKLDKGILYVTAVRGAPEGKKIAVGA